MKIIQKLNDKISEEIQDAKKLPVKQRRSRRCTRSKPCRA